jgi:hypothetical protein
MSSCLKWLNNHDSKVVFMTAWKSSNGIHISSLATKLAFKPLVEINEYWRNDSIKSNYCCPECGYPPCHCDAVIYIKHFDQ